MAASLTPLGVVTLPTLAGTAIAKESSENRGYNFTENELKNLYDGFSQAGVDFSTILNQSDESIKEWIKNNENFSQSIKDDADLLVKNKGELLSWLNMTKESKEELSQYTKEMIRSEISQNENLQSKIEKASGGNKEIEKLITDALIASPSGVHIQGNLQIDAENARLNSESIDSNEDLKNFLVEKNKVDISNLGLTRGKDLSDEDIIKAYLKLKGYSDLDIQKIDISQKNGKVNASWTEKGADALGAHEAKESILSEADFANLRKSIAYDVSFRQSSDLLMRSTLTRRRLLSFNRKDFKYSYKDLRINKRI